MTDNKKLKIDYKPIADLIPYIRNARSHSEDQVKALANSIRRFGFNNPILIDGKNGIIAGHGRVMAAMQIGLSQVPTIELAHLTENQKRAFILADNRVSEMSEWNINILDAELFDLQETEEDLGLDALFEKEVVESKKNEATLHDFSVTTAYDKFWISVRGPLQHQAKVLKLLAEIREQIPQIEVEIGINEQDHET